ncbi:MAG: toprim domain-containing protein [Candidatus Thermoplasmatota archaeon]
MRLYQLGLHNVVALCGTSASPHQVNLLASASRLLLVLDGDEAGRDGAHQLMSKLPGLERQIVLLPSGADPADLSDYELLRLVPHKLRSRACSSGGPGSAAAVGDLRNSESLSRSSSAHTQSPDASLGLFQHPAATPPNTQR